jgi:hypothetical protein
MSGESTLPSNFSCLWGAHSLEILVTLRPDISALRPLPDGTYQYAHPAGTGGGLKSAATVAPQKVPLMFSKLNATLHAPLASSTREGCRNIQLTAWPIHQDAGRFASIRRGDSMDKATLRVISTTTENASRLDFCHSTIESVTSPGQAEPAGGNGAPSIPAPADPPPEASSCARG